MPSASVVTLNSPTDMHKTHPGCQPAMTAPGEQSVLARVLIQSSTPPLSSEMPPLLISECLSLCLPAALKARGGVPVEEAGDGWPATALSGPHTSGAHVPPLSNDGRLD